MVSTKLVLKLNKTDRSGKSPIYLRITQNRKHAYINSGIKVDSKFWDDSKQKLKTHYPNAGAANAMLRKLQFKAESVGLELEQEGKFYSAQLVKEMVTNKNHDNLIDYAYTWINKRKEAGIISHSSLVKYRSVIDKLSTYCNGYLPIGEFNKDLIRNFKTHLKTYHNNKSNTISSNLSCLRAIANTLMEEGRMKPDVYPFRGFRLKYENSKRSFLTQDQINRIRSLQLPDGSKIKKCRDIFFFCTQTGLRIGDALHLKKSNFNGTHIHFFSQKTKEDVSLKLTRSAAAVIKPYIEDERGASAYIFGILNPRKQMNEVTALNDQKSATSLINKNLKIIAKRCGIAEPISTHLGRHSLATNALLKGLSMEEVKGILNHSDIQTTQIYAKVVDSMKDNAIDKLDSQDG